MGAIKPLILTILLCSISFSSFIMAHDKVIVIPMPYDQSDQKIIKVGKDGETYSDPIEALNSVTQARFNNRFTIQIGPGEYILSQPLRMKPYVDVIGSGNGKTVIAGSFSDPSSDFATVYTTHFSSISNLSIKNLGGSGGFGVGIYHLTINLNEMVSIFDVDVTVEGNSNFQSGIYLVASTIPRFGFPRGLSATISNVTIRVDGGTRNYGVTTLDGSLSVNNSDIVVLPGSSSEAGILSGTTGFPAYPTEVAVDHSTIIAANDSLAISLSFAGFYQSITTSITNSVLSSAITQVNSPACDATLLPDGTSLSANCTTQ